MKRKREEKRRKRKRKERKKRKEEFRGELGLLWGRALGQDRTGQDKTGQEKEWTGDSPCNLQWT
tara:strand:- start:456 stop:647 length:192 start_codon:yes stop_codon:yes gene_type:complete